MPRETGLWAACGHLYEDDGRQQKPGKVRAFAYLNAELANVDAIVAGIRAARVPTEAFIRGLPDARRQALAGDGLVIHKEPRDLSEVLEACSVFIHHGGIATAERCLRKGVPQLLLPNHLEQKLNASALSQAGVGQAVLEARTADRAAIADAMRCLVDEPQYRHEARELAATLAGQFPRSPCADIAAACAALL